MYIYIYIQHTYHRLRLIHRRRFALAPSGGARGRLRRPGLRLLVGVSVLLYIYIYMYVCMYVCIYIYIYICVCIHLYGIYLYRTRRPPGSGGW